MKLIAGYKLSQEQRLQVLSAFNNRYTGQHRPRWTYTQVFDADTGTTHMEDKTLPNGETYKPTHETDMEWIESHAFYFTNSGRLSRRHTHCEPVFLAED